MSPLILSQMFPAMSSAETEKCVWIRKYIEYQAHDDTSFQLRMFEKP